MNKTVKLFLAVVLLPGLVSFGVAGSQYVGQLVQQITADSLPLPAGAATATKQDTGNASLSSIDSKIPASPSQEHTSAGSPSSIRLSDGSAFYKATTPTDTQPVSAASLPLPTGAATSAAQTTGNASLSSIDGKLPSQGQAAMAASVPVVIASNQSAVPIQAATSSAPVHISVTATTTSSQLIAANSSRKGIECKTSCVAPAVRVFFRFGASAATSADMPMEACSSWEPPAMVIPTSAIQVIAASSTQGVTCVEY